MEYDVRNKTRRLNFLMNKKIFAILTVFLLSAVYVHAQSANSSVPPPVQYIVSPENPGPNSLVNIEVEGVGQFLGNATLTWQKDGVTVASGVGQKSYSFTTGGVGHSTTIHIVINSSTQGIITHDFVFNPSIINMVWEANTYTPPLYKGKALYTGGSRLTVVAFPTVVLSGTVIPSSKLSFQWSNNDTPNTSASGLGQNTFTFDGDQIQSGETVGVQVYYNNNSVGKAQLYIPSSQPQIIFYQQDPLRGELLDQALSSSFSLPNKEVTVKAEPYFFAKGSNLSYDWTLDGQETSGPQSAQGLLTLRQTGSGSGSTNLGVTIQNTDSANLLQQADASLELIFGQSGGSALSNFFGL